MTQGRLKCEVAETDTLRRGGGVAKDGEKHGCLAVSLTVVDGERHLGPAEGVQGEKCSSYSLLRAVHLCEIVGYTKGGHDFHLGNGRELRRVVRDFEDLALGEAVWDRVDGWGEGCREAGGNIGCLDPDDVGY